MRFAVDSDNIDLIPNNLTYDGHPVEIIAYYVDGEPGTATAGQVSRFMGGQWTEHWTITRKPGVPAKWADVENGTMSAAEGAQMLHDGEVEGLYFSLDRMQEMVDAVNATGHTAPWPKWTAHWDANGVDSGADATQIRSPSSNPPSEGHYDITVTSLPLPGGPPAVTDMTEQREEIHEPTADATGQTLNAPVVDAAYIPGGYYIVTADGGVFTFGVAKYWGSIPDNQAGVSYSRAADGSPQRNEGGEKMGALNGSIIAVAAVDQNGYVLFGDDGGVFTFGDTTFHGAV